MTTTTWPQLSFPRVERPLKLLYLLPAEAFGGAERQGIEHIRRLPDHGVEVTPLVGPGDVAIRALEAAGVRRYVYVPDFPRTGRARPAWAGTVGDWLEWFKASRRSVHSVLREAARTHFDLVFANRSIAWPLAGLISSKLGIPYVIRAGGRPANPLTSLPLLLMRLLLPAPNLFVANCEAVRASLAGWFACPSRLLRNGVDTSIYTPRDPLASRRRLELPLDVPIVGMSARPAPEKGIPYFARVVRGVLQSAPDALFVVAGEHVTRSHYERLMRDLGVADRVRFLGHVQDMPSFYASCDLVVLTSPRVSIEGSPNALLEAMAMARPVVSTRVGGVPELVRHGVDGFLAEPEEPEGFVEHVVRLLQHTSLRRAMGSSGRRRVLGGFCAEAVANELAGIVRAHARARRPETTNPAALGSAPATSF